MRSCLGDVAGDGHAEAMGLGGDGVDVCGLHRTIDFHLLEAGIVIAVHPLLCLIGRYSRARRREQGTVAVDDAGGENSRAEAAALRDGVANGGDEFEFVAAIANGSRASGEIDWAPLDLFEMGVHVPEAGQDGSCPRVNDFGVALEF